MTYLRVIERLENMLHLALEIIDEQSKLLQQHGIETDSGKASRHVGYELYLLLSKRLLALWVFYPVLLLGKWTGLGPRAYRWIADRRTSLFGVCQTSSLPDRYTRLGRDMHLDG